MAFSIICGSILKTGHSHEMLLEDPAWPRDIDGYPPKWPDKSCLGIVINYINDISIWISIFLPGLCRCLLLLEWQLPRCFASPRLGNQLVPKRRFGHTPNAVVPYAFVLLTFKITQLYRSYKGLWVPFLGTFHLCFGVHASNMSYSTHVC